MSLPSTPRIRFGSFEVDTRSGELRCEGSKINLQDQPFQALVLLLERPGEVVTREELSQRLWPQDTFVDFDRGLNKAINKLRVALGDDAENPHYIETLPQRGYRFISPVETPAQFPPLIDSLAVLPLRNLSGDPAQDYFSDGLTEELICSIARIASLRVISRTSVTSYKESPKSLPAIAQELRVDAILESSGARSDQKIRITVQLILAPEDRHLWSAGTSATCVTSSNCKPKSLRASPLKFTNSSIRYMPSQRVCLKSIHRLTKLVSKGISFATR